MLCSGTELPLRGREARVAAEEVEAVEEAGVVEEAEAEAEAEEAEVVEEEAAARTC